MSLQIAAEAFTSSGALVTGVGNPQGPCLPKLTKLTSRGHKVQHCSPSCSDCKRLTHDVEEMFNELLLFHATFFTSYFLKWKWTERGAGWFWKCCWKRPVLSVSLSSGRLCGGSTRLLWSWTDRRDRQTCLVLLCLAACWLLRSKSGCCSEPPFADSFLLALISSLYSVKVYSRWEKHDLVWEMWTMECEPCKDTAAHLKCKNRHKKPDKAVQTSFSPCCSTKTVN